jgi:O-succinylbenzoic acid--CoA ligase
VRVGALVAVVARGTPDFVDVLRRTWDAGDAVAPVDPRLPAPAAEALLDSLAPAALVDPDDGERRARPGGRPVEPGDALVVATSGTTGAPKGAVLTHAAVAASAEATSARLGIDPDRDRWLACLPLAHVGGLSVVTRALHTGTPLTVLPRPEPAAVEEAARTGGATLVSLVATALARLDGSGFRAIVLGGAAPPATLPANALTTWGMTETGSGVVYDREPLPGVELAVVDGELRVRGPMLARAYRDGTSTVDGDGWLATGDAAHLDEAGRLAVHGRMGDVIVTGGEKVWPDPVEAVLRTVPGVAEVAVAGRPDPEWGHAVVAWVVPEDRARPPSLDALRDAAKARLAPWAAPRRLVVVDRLPRTALGKVRRSQLAGGG